jgi:hypothetical protein
LKILAKLKVINKEEFRQEDDNTAAVAEIGNKPHKSIQIDFAVNNDLGDTNYGPMQQTTKQSQPTYGGLQDLSKPKQEQGTYAALNATHSNEAPYFDVN